MSRFTELPLAAYPDEVFADLPASHEYSPRAALILCWLAQLAYESDVGKIDAIARRLGFEAPAPFTRKKKKGLPLSVAKGLFVEGRHAVVLAFAGTDPANFPDIVTDVNVGLRRDGLHAGFTTATDAAFEDSKAALALARHTGKAFFITGHSLGGAIAVLTALRLREEREDVADGVYTWGMPRAGRQSLIDACGEALGRRTFRHMHGIDGIPTLPPPELGFAHVGRLVACGRYARFPDEPGDDWKSNEPSSATALANGVAAQLENFRKGSGIGDAEARARGLAHPELPPGVSDHLPDRYLTALGWDFQAGRPQSAKP